MSNYELRGVKKEMARILVVDDDSDIAMLIDKHLTKMGYEVVGKASSGEEAIAKAKKLRPDLILMDIVMPGEKSGIDAAEEIKSEMNVPLIFLTAHTDEKVIESAKKVEPSGFIAKPYKEGELRAAIEIALYEKEMELKRIGGIFDELIEGIPAGSLIYFSADPTIASELVIYQLCGVRKTYYFVTEWNPKRVEEGMKEAGVNLENVEIIDFRERKRSTSEIISTLKRADDANMIIDTFIPFSNNDSLDLVKEILEECMEKDVLCFLVMPRGACDEIVARRIAYMCDVFFDLCADRIGDEVIVKFGAPKIRGVCPMKDYMRLKIEARRVEIDTSRDIV